MILCKKKKAKLRFFRAYILHIILQYVEKETKFILFILFILLIS